MKKILIVSYGMGCGGAEKSLVSFLNRIPKGRWEVELLIANPNGIYMKQIPDTVNLLTDQFELENYATPMKLRRKKVCGFHDFFNQVRWKFTFKKLFQNLSWNERRWQLWGRYLPTLEKEYDLAISYMNGPTNYYVIEKVKAKKKVLWIHNEYQKLDVNYEYERPFYEKADKIVTISQDCVDSFVEIYPHMEDKMCVLENISSPEVIRKAANNIPEGDVFFQYEGVKILSIGRLSQQKGYEFSIAAAKVLKEQEISFLWYVLGEGELRQTLEAAIRDNGLEENMKLIGIRENPYPYIAQCDIFAQTSHYEGKSIALDEAKILCKPIVVTKYATVGASITNQVNGLIAEMNGVSVAEKILEMISDTAMKEKLIACLRQNDSGNEKEIDKYFSLIEGLLKEAEGV